MSKMKGAHRYKTDVRCAVVPAATSYWPLARGQVVVAARLAVHMSCLCSRNHKMGDVTILQATRHTWRWKSTLVWLHIANILALLHPSMHNLDGVYADLGSRCTTSLWQGEEYAV